jgi:hypothetical protein
MRIEAPGSFKWEITFDLIIEKSQEIRNLEHQFYTLFTDSTRGTLSERKEQYSSLMAYQAIVHPENIVPATARKNIIIPSSKTGSPLNTGNGVSPGTAITVDEENVELALKKGMEKDGATPARSRKRSVSESHGHMDAPTKKPRLGTDPELKSTRDAKAAEDHRRFLEHKDTIIKWYLG